MDFIKYKCVWFVLSNSKGRNWPQSGNSVIITAKPVTKLSCYMFRITEHEDRLIIHDLTKGHRYMKIIGHTDRLPYRRKI